MYAISDPSPAIACGSSTCLLKGVQMKQFFIALIAVTFLFTASFSSAQRADFTLSNEKNRSDFSRQLRQRHEIRKKQAEAIARFRKYRIRGATSRGRTFELVGAENRRIQYNATDNANAAITSGASQIRNTAPYGLNGGGQKVGLWDGGSVRATHQEFGGRVNLINNVDVLAHSTHVAGTIGASGVISKALGMAPSVTIDSYDWDADAAEMAAAAAAAPGQPDKIGISNHSYGIIAGWDYGDFADTGAGNYYWFGTPGEREDSSFGRYDVEARDWDSITYAAPYYLPVKSAGNDRTDIAPSSGNPYYFWQDDSWTSKTYSSATDPYGDGFDNGGFDTIATNGCAKNILTVGAVDDAVSGTARYVPNAHIATFSGWGPADDGRVKPDIMGNGLQLYSASSYYDADYESMSGTSMAAPNVTGSAVLLIQYYAKFFAGQAMRASTLKALIIHTADDLDNPGPDYRTGWGLIDVKAAADLIRAHGDLPSARIIHEGLLSTAHPSDAMPFRWDGVSPIRATLCWTDPPGSIRTTLDDATRVLVNDLDIRVVSPDGSITYMPYVLDRGNPSAFATSGDNKVDNVEQINIAAPPAPGIYGLTVTHKGVLFGDEQAYSLILTGQASDDLHVSPFDETVVAGPAGGPFSPLSVTYTLANKSAAPLDWQTTKTQSWLDLSAASGTIAPGTSVTVTASINDQVNSLAVGAYSETITFTNSTSGIAQFRRINVNARAVDAFVINTIASPRYLNHAFPITITAVDSQGLPVPGFAGMVSIAAEKAGMGEVAIGSGGSDWEAPMSTHYKNSRLQTIYLASEISRAGKLTSLSLFVDSPPPPSTPMTKWTIRLKHTSLSKYISANAWESGGWTTVYQADENVTTSGWYKFTFQSPFDYNGTDNLMVDFSFSNSTYADDSGWCSYDVPGQQTGTATNRSLWFTSDSMDGDPLTWSAGTPLGALDLAVPDLLLGMENTIAITPIVSGSFVNGVWHGPVTLSSSSPAVELKVNDGNSHAGTSNVFAVSPDAPPARANAEWMLY